VPTHDHRTGKARSGDVELFYRCFGHSGRSPILITHGLSFFSYDWIDVAARLADDREVVPMDMRGFGESSWSPAKDYKLETLSGDVVNLLDALGWPRAVLMGHSFGGRIVLATTGWRPDRVAALICVDFAPDIAAVGRRRVAERIGRQPDLFGSVEKALSYDGYEPETASAAVRARYEAFLRKRDGGYELRRDVYFRDNFKRALETGQSTPVPAFLWSMLADTQVPVLVIRGTRSDMFAPETVEKVRTLNQRARVVELESGNDIAGENPAGLADAVRTFLDDAGL
jgi:esterase